jgi:hypothetical protein
VISGGATANQFCEEVYLLHLLEAGDTRVGELRISNDDGKSLRPGDRYIQAVL